MTKYTDVFPSAADAFRSSLVGDEGADRVVHPEIVMPILEQQPAGCWTFFDLEMDESADIETKIRMEEELRAVGDETVLVEWSGGEDEYGGEDGYGGVSVREDDRFKVVQIWYGGCSGCSALTSYVILRKK